jgi:hypothetical protein
VSAQETIPITEDEHAALIDASHGGRRATYTIGAQVALVVEPGSRWAVAMLARMRGVTVPDGYGGDQ